jgi:hypothetical protein
MATAWWQKLRQPQSRQNILRTAEATFGFRTSHSQPAGWCVQTETAPVRVGLVASAKVLPALMTGYTYDFAEERRIPRGTERLALLQKWATVASRAESSVNNRGPSTSQPTAFAAAATAFNP